MRGKLLIVVLFVVAVAGVVWLAQRRGALTLPGTSAGGGSSGASSGAQAVGWSLPSRMACADSSEP